MPLSVCLLATAAVLAVAPPELKTAETAMAAYKYADAQKALIKARAAKNLDRASLLRILELQGIAAGQLRQSAPSSAAFKELLTLDPAHKLDQDYAPRVMTPFLEAGQQVTEAGALEIKPRPPEVRERRIVGLSVEVPRDAMKLVRSVVFHLSLGAVWQDKPLALTNGTASVATDGAEVQWWVELIGDNQAQLVTLGTPDAPLTATPPPPVVTAPPPPTPVAEPVVTKPVDTGSGGGVRTASYVVLGGAVVTAGVGVAMGVMSNSALSSITQAQRNAQGQITGLTEREAVARGQQAATQGTIANICFVGAGVLGATGVVMWLVGGPSAPTKVSLAPAAGGAVISGSFP
ncbi:MAG: hypothetical protein U0228_10290 [Myxococcaceae bacterium]